jgi:hypothetical protein
VTALSVEVIKAERRRAVREHERQVCNMYGGTGPERIG